MKRLIATVVSIREDPDNRYHATATIVVPDNMDHVELMLEGICADADASALSDVKPWNAFDRNFRSGQTAL
jgi:hypothetical protein